MARDGPPIEATPTSFCSLIREASSPGLRRTSTGLAPSAFSTVAVAAQVVTETPATPASTAPKLMAIRNRVTKELEAITPDVMVSPSQTPRREHRNSNEDGGDG